MKIRDLMISNVETSQPDALLSEAAERMKAQNIGFLPIRNSATGKLDGVLTDRDIAMAALAAKKPLTDIHIRDAMTKQVRTCRPDADVQDAHELMRTHRIRRLAVTDDAGTLVGVVSLGDLAHAASGKLLSHARSEVAETLDATRYSHLAR